MPYAIQLGGGGARGSSKKGCPPFIYCQGVSLRTQGFTIVGQRPLARIRRDGRGVRLWASETPTDWPVALTTRMAIGATHLLTRPLAQPQQLGDKKPRSFRDGVRHGRGIGTHRRDHRKTWVREMRFQQGVVSGGDSKSVQRGGGGD